MFDADDCDLTDSEDDGEDISALHREAVMPIDEVLATNYTGSTGAAGLAPPLRLGESGSGVSPMLRARRGVTGGNSTDDGSSSSSIEVEAIKMSSLEEETEEGAVGKKKSGDKSSLQCENSSDAEKKGECAASVDDNSSVSNITSNVNSSDTKVMDKSDSSNNTKINNTVDTPSLALVNGKVNCDEGNDERTTGLVNGDCVNNNNNNNGEVVSDSLVVEGKKIDLCKEENKTEQEQQPAYTGKGKSGGKGGKVKGASAITTTTLTADTAGDSGSSAAGNSSGNAATIGSTRAKRRVDCKHLTAEDLDSEDDDDDANDETFAVK